MIRNYRFGRQVRQNKTNRDAVRNMVNDLFYYGDEKTIYLYLDRDKNEFWHLPEEIGQKHFYPSGLSRNQKVKMDTTKNFSKLTAEK